MKRAMLAAAVLLLLPLFSAAQTTEPAATLVLVNGKIFTSDGANPFVEAVAIAESKIIATGSTEVIRRRVRPGTRVIDLGGRTAIPGINDAHIHPGRALPAFGVEAGLDPTLSQISDAIAAGIDETPADVFILATVGASIINNPNVTRATLDGIAANRRIVMMAFTGHGLIMSSAAMSALGVADDTADPPGGRFGRDANGKLNGRAFEYAQYQVERRLFDLASNDDLLQHAATLSDQLIRLGITSIQAMPLVTENRFALAWKATRTKVRLRVMDFPLTLTEPVTTGTKGVKWILDGTPIELGAALRTTRYPDGSQGRLNFDDIRPNIRVAVNAKQQLLVHAAGDGAVAQFLTTLDRITPKLERPRIEHGDGLQKDLFELALKHGVVVVQNPTHFPFRTAYPRGEYMLAKSLIAAGIPLAFGSDGLVNPYLNIMEAVDRDVDAEELTRQEAVIAYTFMSAFAESAEKEKGRIAPGFLADIAVLSQDIFSVPLASLPETTSVLTIIDGDVVFSEI